MVRTTGNESFQARLCYCGKVFRGADFRRHIAKISQTLGSAVGHGERLHSQVCVACNVLRKTTVAHKIFYGAHEGCKSLPMSTPAFVSLMLTEAMTVARAEMDDAMSKIMDAQECAPLVMAEMTKPEGEQREEKPEGEQREEEPVGEQPVGEQPVGEKPVGEETVKETEKDVDLDASGPIAGRKRVRRLSDSSDESSIHVPGLFEPVATSSKVGGIKRQCTRWKKDDEAAKASQQEAHRCLLDRYNSLNVIHQRTLKEKDAADATIRALKKKGAEHEGILMKMRKLESDVKKAEVEVRKEKLAKTEFEVELTREKKERAAEREELARLRERVEELESERRDGVSTEHIDFHIPLRENRVCDVPTHTRSLEETMRCYDDPENGVACLHAHAEVLGRLVDLKFRRGTVKLKAKK